MTDPAAAASTAAGRTVFTGDLGAPDPIPAAGIEAAVELMRDGRLFRYGEAGSGVPEAALLEEEFAAYMGRRYCLGVNSGGASLFLALKACGVEAGDKVLVNAFTLAPVPGAIRHAGAEAVLVDIDDRFVIDVDDLDRKAADSGAKVLMLSYMRGHIPDMGRVMDVVERHGLVVVEDCAHTMGASWDGRLTGTFGAVGCFSTQTFKHMNSGEGGLLVTDDADIAARAILHSGSYMLYAQHKARPDTAAFEPYRGDCANFSMRMSNLVAAVLRPQLAELPRQNERRRRVHATLARQIADIPHLRVPARPQAEDFIATSVQFLVDGLDAAAIDAFVADAAAHGVHVKWFGAAEASGFTSRHDHWTYLDPSQSVPRADRLLGRLCDIRLPSHLTDDDCTTIAAVLREAMAATRGGGELPV